MKRIFYILLFISSLAKAQDFSARVNAVGITSAGTITSGTWNGTAIAGQYGGTGVANTGKTITLGGNLTTSGAFATTFTMSNTTTVTFPTTGTLYGTASGSITSNQLLTSLSDETGSGVAVFATTPTLVTPVLGVATATSINKLTITAPATSATLTVVDGGSLITAGAFATTLTSTATTNATLPAGTNTLYSTLASSITSAQMLSSMTDETGTGVLVFGTTPTLTTPVLGVATATSINKVTITAPGTSATLTLITGSSLITAGAFALTLTSSATTNATFPSGTGTLAYLAGANTWTGIQTFNSGVTTGTTTTSGMVHTDNSLTSGTGQYMSSSSITSGNLLNLVTTGTVAAAGNTGLNINRSGVNGTNAITVTGETISVTNTNVTSGTNIGLNVTASGATTNNIAIQNTGHIIPSANNLYDVGSSSNVIANLYAGNVRGNFYLSLSGGDVQFSTTTTTNAINFYFNASATQYGKFYPTTGNFAVQNGGSFTDNGSRLQTTSLSTAYVVKTANYTLTAADYTANASSGTFQFTLPTAVGIAGRIYVLTNSGAGTITIGTTSSQTFSNVVATPTTLTMDAVGSRTVQSDGANWLLLSSL